MCLRRSTSKSAADALGRGLLILLVLDRFLRLAEGSALKLLHHLRKRDGERKSPITGRLQPSSPFIPRGRLLDGRRT
jgi:hypothetical protein